MIGFQKSSNNLIPMKRYVIIVAGGQGHRLGGEIPKQFLLLKGKPVLFHTLEKFDGIVNEIILVLPSSHIQYWRELCEEYNYASPISIVPGGTSRTSSVMKGLLTISTPGIVAIHDAVRPLVSKQLINNLFTEAEKSGNAVPAIPVRESLRIRRNYENQAVNREDYISVQTPQCFDYNQIMFAYNNSGNQIFSDDAGVFENSGGRINVIEGETHNIKITFKEDIAFAEALLDAINM